MKTSLRYVCAGFGLTALLVGCSQKDPNATSTDAALDDCSSTNDTPDFSDVGVGKSYYPVVKGASWVYRHEGGSTTWDEEVHLEATTDGSDNLLSLDTPGPSGSRSESVLSVDGAVVYRTEKEVYVGDTLTSRVEYDPGFIRFDMAWLSQGKECTRTVSYLRKEWDGYGVLQRNGDRSHIYQVLKVDAKVSVAAGDFEGCLVVKRARLSGTALNSDEEDNKEFTFCPGVGKVLEKELLTGKTESLVSCEIPGGKCP